MEWQDIETAPKDGTQIWLIALDKNGVSESDGAHLMQWGHIQKNGLFPDRVGMWTAPDGSYTWTDGDGFGPTHWAPRKHPTPKP